MQKTIIHGIFLLGAFCISSAYASDKLDINSASEKEINERMIMIGPKKAEAIIAYRQINGPFRAIEDIAKVNGISMKTLEKNREFIEVKAPPKIPVQGK